MKILDYKFSDKSWNFQKVEFQDVNLIVGDSGTGKTRLLNTIFNLGSMVAKKQVRVIDSNWSMTLAVGKNKYFWKVSTILDQDIAVVNDEELLLNDNRIFVREKTKLTFRGKSTFKIPANETGISILREEDDIKPLFTGFSRILRRRFFTDDVEKNSAIQTMSTNLLDKLGHAKDLNKIFEAELGLNLRLFLLKTYFFDIYKKIVGIYLSSFKFIKEANIIYSDKLESLDIPFSSTPIFCIKEQSTDKEWIGMCQ